MTGKKKFRSSQNSISKLADPAEPPKAQSLLKAHAKSLLEAVSDNTPLLGAASVVAISVAALAPLASWETLIEVKKAVANGDPIALLVPLAAAILALTGAHVTWSLTLGSRHNSRMNEVFSLIGQLRQEIIEISAYAARQIDSLKEEIDRIAADVIHSNTVRTVRDTNEIWRPFVQSLLVDGSTGTKEVTLIEIENAYNAIVWADRVGDYIVERLRCGSGLTSWSIILYWPEGDNLFATRAREPAIRFVAMIEGCAEIARRRGISVDLAKLQICLSGGVKPDCASFITFRARADGLFEKILVEYGRPIERNRAHQATDRVTIITDMELIGEREAEVLEHVNHCQKCSFNELQTLVTPYLKSWRINDPENLPGVVAGDHFQLEDWREAITSAEDELSKLSKPDQDRALPRSK